MTESGTTASIGTVGDSYALAETINELYKAELIKPRKPWRTVEQAELVNAEWVDWLNHRRLYESVEFEAAYYAHHRAHPAIR